MKKISEYWSKIEASIPFIIIVWTIGFYILNKVTKYINLDNPDKIHKIHLLFLMMAFFFILLPFFKTIKIGNYLEIERNIKETQEDVKNFKSEVRQSIQMLSSSVTASIGNMNNHVTFNIPGMEDMKKEIRKFKNQPAYTSSSQLTEIKEELLLEDDDITMALARTRIKLEGLLRTALNKKTNITNPEVKFLGLNSLFKQFVDLNPRFRDFKNPFRYVQEVCNAAIHGQRVPIEQAEEALLLGAYIIGELNKEIDNQKNKNQ